jgi:hypothetical protein
MRRDCESSFHPPDHIIQVRPLSVPGGQYLKTIFARFDQVKLYELVPVGRHIRRATPQIQVHGRPVALRELDTDTAHTNVAEKTCNSVARCRPSERLRGG